MRDLILKRTPKDFDIITSAELKEVPSSLKVFFFFLPPVHDNVCQWMLTVRHWTYIMILCLADV